MNHLKHAKQLAFIILITLVYTSKCAFTSPSHQINLTNAEDSSTHISIRSKRQAATVCDFGTEPSLVTCDWNSRNTSILKWELGAGVLSNWLGGPSKDAGTGEDSDRGGYIFFETSISAAQFRVDDITIREGQNAYLESPIMKTTGAEGKCVSFSYSIDGLSAAGLQVILQPLNKDGRPDGFARALWSTKDPTNKAWMETQTLYTFNRDHQIVFEGIAKDLRDPFRKFRGYVAVDNVGLKSGLECKGHCSFEGGFCGWINDEDDDFNWSLGRGSRNPSTGPATDRSSFNYGGMEGGYAYIDSSYPRRPGDVAKLSSTEFEATGSDTPMCLRFWTHMYGNGVGSLTVSVTDTREAQERDIWSLQGQASENAWYPAEVPVSNTNPFKVVITAKVGRNNLGDIAVDDISLTPGTCPTAPQSAALQSGDCTFEVDECGWSNVLSRDRLDDIDWERATGAAMRSNIHDHTLGNEKGYFMALTRSPIQRPGSRGWFTSRDFRIMPAPNQGSGTTGPRCLSFWFIMNEAYIDPSGPSLGALTVYSRSNERDNNGNFIMKPVWKLYNHQGPDWQYAQAPINDPNDAVVIEGIWGSSRASGFIAFDDLTFFTGSCTTLPRGAKVRPGECRFERDLCDWSNVTDKSQVGWKPATVTRRPSNMPDKTFGAPEGYVYYDLYSENSGSNYLVKLMSPLIPAGEDSQLCFSFWYAAFGASNTALMQISKADSNSSDSPTEKVWSLEAKSIDTTKPMWMPAQFTVDSSRDFYIIMEGQATNGGFAVDDIIFTPGSCPTRPEKANVKNQAKS